MENEQTNKTDETGDKSNPDVKKTEGVSIVDEARAIRDEIVKAKEDLKVQNDRKEKLQANELLSSSAGGRQEPQVKKEETPLEYRDRIDKEISEGQHAD